MFSACISFMWIIIILFSFTSVFFPLILYCEICTFLICYFVNFDNPSFTTVKCD
uniref:Uncharacterized protein n=1 Tax=Anguilla anguilla TaxID=7936 RepID=A0A0E9WJJ6_ANGAN